VRCEIVVREYLSDAKRLRKKNRLEISPMLTKTTAALAAALIVGSASLALASDNNSGDYSGGFVIPGSTDGVNPAYHRDLPPRATNGAKSFGFAPTAHRPLVHQRESGNYR
jgi:hypothetical protein